MYFLNGGNTEKAARPYTKRSMLNSSRASSMPMPRFSSLIQLSETVSDVCCTTRLVTG